MEYNINSITANDARSLDKLRRHYENLMASQYLRQNIKNLESNYNRVMEKIQSLTQPLLEINIYSIPGIGKPIEL